MVWRGVHRAPPAADYQARVLSLAVGWKCLESLCKQAVSPLRAGASQLCGVTQLSQLWAKPSADHDPMLLWGKDCIAVGSSSLGAPFPSAHKIFVALCYYDVCLPFSFSYFVFLKIFFDRGSEHKVFCVLILVSWCNPNILLATGPRSLF